MCSLAGPTNIISHCTQIKSRISEKSSSHLGYLVQFYYFITCWFDYKCNPLPTHDLYSLGDTVNWKYIPVALAIPEAELRESVEYRISGPAWAIQ